MSWNLLRRSVLAPQNKLFKRMRRNTSELKLLIIFFKNCVFETEGEYEFDQQRLILYVFRLWDMVRLADVHVSSVSPSSEHQLCFSLGVIFYSRAINIRPLCFSFKLDSFVLTLKIKTISF